MLPLDMALEILSIGWHGRLHVPVQISNLTAVRSSEDGETFLASVPLIFKSGTYYDSYFQSCWQLQIILVDGLAQCLAGKKTMPWMSHGISQSACVAVVTNFTWMCVFWFFFFSPLAMKKDLPFKIIVTFILCMCKCTACHDTHVKVREQLAGTGCLLPPCGVLGIKVKPSGSAASAFTRWAILLAPLELFLLASMTVWRKLFKHLWENQVAKSHRIPLSCMRSLPGCGDWSDQGQFSN